MEEPQMEEQHNKEPGTETTPQEQVQFNLFTCSLQ